MVLVLQNSTMSKVRSGNSLSDISYSTWKLKWLISDTKKNEYIFLESEVLTSVFKICRLQMLYKIGFLKNYLKLKGKHLCWRFFLIKLQALRPEDNFRRLGAWGNPAISTV